MALLLNGRTIIRVGCRRLGLLAELARRGQADVMLAAGKTTTIDLA
jgi:hypothetical protein